MELCWKKSLKNTNAHLSNYGIHDAHCIRTRHESCPLQQIPMLFPQPQGQTEEANQAFILLRRLGSQKKQISSNKETLTVLGALCPGKPVQLILTPGVVVASWICHKFEHNF